MKLFGRFMPSAVPLRVIKQGVISKTDSPKQSGKKTWIASLRTQ
jgi:hypothetical protein